MIDTSQLKTELLSGSIITHNLALGVIAGTVLYYILKRNNVWQN